MRAEDIPQVCELLKSNSAKMLSNSFGNDLDEKKVSNDFYNSLTSDINNKLIFLAYLKKSKKLLGYVSIINIDWVKGVAEISVIVHEKYQCIGYGPLINSAAIVYCFEELNLRKVYSKVRIDNTNIPDRINRQLFRKIPVGDGSYIDYYYGEVIKGEEI